MTDEAKSKVVLGPNNPWPGLNQFFEDNDRYFRGRDEEKAELFRLVKSETLTILFGKSGLGKSSLLQAGLFPLLRQAGHLPVFIHIRHDDPAASDGNNAPPLASQVYAALREACDASKVEAPEIREEERLWEYFHRTEAAFWNERNRLVTPVLAFDQFEEAFTLGVEDDRRRKRRDDFLTQLEDLIENRPPQALRERWDRDPELVSEFEQDHTPCKVIVSLREDFLPDLEQLKEKIRSIMHNRFRLERMDGGKAWQVVTGETIVDGEPRRALSHLVDEDVALKIIDFVSKTRGQRVEDTLTRETLRDRTVDPALLSVVCSELNNRRRATQPPQDKISFTLVSQTKEEIIREFFNGHIKTLGAGAGPARRFIEEDLITGSGFRKRCAMEDALRQPGVTRDDLRRLEQQRILRFEPIEGITWIELTHDLLTEVVYASRLRRREREERAKVEALAAAKKKKVLWYAGLALFMIASVVLGLMWREAEKARGEADEARGEADEARRKAEWSWEQAEKYFVQYTAEKISHQLSEPPPNIARAQLFARGAWNLGIAKPYPYIDYAAAISLFGEAPLFAPKTILHFDKPIRQIAYSADGRLGVLDEDGNFRILDLNVTNDLKTLESAPVLQDHVATFSFHPHEKPIVALRHADQETAILLNYEDNEKVLLPLDTSSPPAGTWESASPTSGKASPKSADTTMPKLGIAFSPYSSQGNLLAIARTDGTVRIFSVVDMTSADCTNGVRLAEVASTRARPESPSGSEDDRNSDWVLPDGPATVLAFIEIGPVPQLVTANSKGVWVWPPEPQAEEKHPVRDFKGDLAHERLVGRATVKKVTGTEETGTDATSPVGLGTGALGRLMCIAPYNITNGALLFRDNAAWPDPSRGQDQVPLRLPYVATSAACAPDGQLVAVGARSNLVKSGAVYVFRRGEMLQRLDHNGPVTSIAFRPDARALASASAPVSDDDNVHGVVRLWEFSSNGPLSMARQPALATKVALSPNGRRLASLENDRIRLRDANTGILERETKAGDDPIALAVNDDGHVFALTSNANEVTRRDVFDGGKAAWPAREILAHSPDAKWAVCRTDIGLEVVFADNGESKLIEPPEPAPAASQGAFAMSQDGALVAAYDGSAKKITLCTNPWLPSLPARPGADAQTLAVYANPWNRWPGPPEMNLRHTIPCEARLIHLAFGPNERLLFAATEEGDILLFDLETGKQLFRREAGGSVTALSTSVSDAQPKLACAIDGQTMRIWGSASAPDPAELEKAEFEKIAGVTFKDFELIQRAEAEPKVHTAPPMDTATAVFWDAFWETGRRVAALTGQKSADDLEKAYAPVREALERGEPTHCWQAAVMRQRLEVMPPWAPADTAALRARLDAIDGLEAPERVILLRDGILPFAKGDAKVFAAARFRLAVERMDNNKEEVDRVQELAEVLAAGYTEVDEILARWPIDRDAQYARMVENELLPRIPLDRRADQAKVFIALAAAHVEALPGASKTGSAPQGSPSEIDLAFIALEKAVEFGFNNWAAELPRLAKLIDDPRFKPEWLPPSDIIIQSAESSLDHKDVETALRLLRRALEQEPTNFQANLYYGRALRIAGPASWDNAVAALDSAAELAGSPADKASVQVEKGRLWRDSGELEKALGAFDAALKEDPNNRAAKRMRRIVLKELGSANQ